MLKTVQSQWITWPVNHISYTSHGGKGLDLWPTHRETLAYVVSIQPDLSWLVCFILSLYNLAFIVYLHNHNIKQSGYKLNSYKWKLLAFIFTIKTQCCCRSIRYKRDWKTFQLINEVQRSGLEINIAVRFWPESRVLWDSIAWLNTDSLYYNKRVLLYTND